MGIEEGLKFKNRVYKNNTNDSYQIDRTYEGETEIIGIEAPKPTLTQPQVQKTEPQQPVTKKKLKIPVIKL